MPKKDNLAVLRLRNWDLWGPLLITFWLSIVLALGGGENKGSLFINLFLIIFAGSFLISINTNLIGGKVNIF